MSEEQVYAISNEAYNEDYELIKDELANAYKDRVIVDGYVQRWDGKRPVCRALDSIDGIFALNNADDFTLYIKDGQLMMDVSHHDGTNVYTVYKVRKGMAAVMENTESIVPDLVKYFGWEINKKGADKDESGT